MGKIIYMFEEKLLAHKRHVESGCKIWHSCCGNLGCLKCHPRLEGFDKVTNRDKVIYLDDRRKD